MRVHQQTVKLEHCIEMSAVGVEVRGAFRTVLEI